MPMNDLISLDTRYRVALDLMRDIARAEGKSEPGRESREYFLKLYRECLEATDHGSQGKRSVGFTG
jgi:phage anti-repressor protein